MEKKSLILLCVLLIVLSFFLVGCSVNTETKETTLPETENTSELTTELATEPKTEVVTTEKKSIEDVAKEVMNGEWGSGEERRKNLEKAGYDYDEVQAAVNKNVPEQEDSMNSGTNSNEEKEKTTVYDRDKYLSEFDWDSGELPTYPDGSFDAGAMKDKELEELGGEDFYF